MAAVLASPEPVGFCCCHRLRDLLRGIYNFLFFTVRQCPAPSGQRAFLSLAPASPAPVRTQAAPHVFTSHPCPPGCPEWQNVRRHVGAQFHENRTRSAVRLAFPCPESLPLGRNKWIPSCHCSQMLGHPNHGHARRRATCESTLWMVSLEAVAGVMQGRSAVGRFRVQPHGLSFYHLHVLDRHSSRKAL